MRHAIAGSLEKDLQENWQRVSSAFPALESAYFARREALLEQHACQAQPLQRSAAAAQDADAQSRLALGVRGAAEDHISAFSQDLSHFCRHSKLTVGLIHTFSLCSGVMGNLACHHCRYWATFIAHDMCIVVCRSSTVHA